MRSETRVTLANLSPQIVTIVLEPRLSEATIKVFNTFCHTTAADRPEPPFLTIYFCARFISTNHGTIGYLLLDNLVNARIGGPTRILWQNALKYC